MAKKVTIVIGTLLPKSDNSQNSCILPTHAKTLINFAVSQTAFLITLSKTSSLHTAPDKYTHQGR